MKTPQVINPLPPQIGLTVRQGSSTVTVSVNDEGGRGYPAAAIFIPINHVDGKRWGVASNPPGTSNEFSAAELFTASHFVEQYSETPPFVFRVERSEWPMQGDYVLVLLLYKQFDGVGRNRPDLLTDTSRALFDNRAIAVQLWPSVSRPSTLARFRATNPYAEYKTPNVADKIRDLLGTASLMSLSAGLISMAGGPTAPPIAAKNSRNVVNQLAATREAFTFAAVSCLYPSDFLDRMPHIESTRGPADASLLALSDCLDCKKQSDPTKRPSLLLQLGDQVYVDATAGLFDPKAKDDKFRIPYDRRGASPGVQSVLQNFWLEVHSLIDDHEISDNWEPNDPSPKSRESADICLGKEGYRKFQRFDELTPKDPFWRNDLIHKGLPFFLADTRTEREPRVAADWATKKIMSDLQFKALHAWMTDKTHAELPKFVATSSALLPRRLAVAQDPVCALHSDAWDGYPTSLYGLLALACHNEVKGLVFLSGDEHISNLVMAEVTDLYTGKRCTLHSVHSSALYAPYPFANAVKEDFAEIDTFDFIGTDGGCYRCKVTATFAPEGDGFALLTVASNLKCGWQLDVAFHGTNGAKKNQPAAINLFG